MPDEKTCILDEKRTDNYIQWIENTISESDSQFEASCKIVKTLGGTYIGNNISRFSFWAPEVTEHYLSEDGVYVEIIIPQEPINFELHSQSIRVKSEFIPAKRYDNYWAAYVHGAQAGTRNNTGYFYRLTYFDKNGKKQNVQDHLAASIPFGVFAPAELYDIEKMQNERSDIRHFETLDTELCNDNVPRIKAPAHILQIHVKTASKEGTLRGLTEIYRNIAEKLKRNKKLSAFEKHFTDFEAVQLMPIEPIIEYEETEGFWHEHNTSSKTAYSDKTQIQYNVTLSRPDMSNWGYDIVISGSSAINPVLLGSRRPDELIDFISTLHNFPTKPIKIIFDIVYGHSDNQGLKLLNSHFIAGPGMYGQELNFKHPVVRALLLEMQRRKSNFGVDGIRVDGAQDFTYYDSEREILCHDDEYLQLMNDIEQAVAGTRYRPWMIFEDGRPWPRDDWELSSTYLEVTKQLPNVVQWGPLTFAHNTPFVFTFWISKLWRIREIMEHGYNWITGCANHDTLRRGTQVDPKNRVNTYLGKSLPEIFWNAYDNPGTTLFTYGFMPGIPMDFINALVHAPWSFIRNTDRTYGVKIMAEEARFLEWAVTEELYEKSNFFPRLKKAGFHTLNDLKRFLYVLDNAVKISGYIIEDMVILMKNIHPPLKGPELTNKRLKDLFKEWMDDMMEYCNTSHYLSSQNEEHADFNRQLRAFRSKHKWLRNNLTSSDCFGYLHPCNGSVVYYGLRRSPDKKEALLYAGNLEGAPKKVIPAELPIPDINPNGWQCILSAKGVNTREEPGSNANAANGTNTNRSINAELSLNAELTLNNSEGIIFRKRY